MTSTKAGGEIFWIIFGTRFEILRPQNVILNRIHQSGRAGIWHDFRGPKISNLGPENRPKITFSPFGRRHLAGSEKSILCAKSPFSGFQKWVLGGGFRIFYRQKLEYIRATECIVFITVFLEHRVQVYEI